jgi:hypothetical protein
MIEKGINRAIMKRSDETAGIGGGINRRPGHEMLKLLK